MSHIASPFGFSTTAAEVIDGVDLSGKTAIVTGGASGIGIETVRALAGAGAAVTIAARRPDAAAEIAQQLTQQTGGPEIAVRALDIADQASVHRFVDEWTGPVDLLVNNAGILATPELTRTPEGWELQLATNHLGHAALTLGLHDALAAGGGARVVVVSSSGHLYSPVVFDDLHFRFRPYDPVVAYGQSKSATSLFSVALTNQWADDGIFSNSVMPGAIATNLQRHTGGLRTPAERRKTPEQGAATTVWAAVSPLLDGVGGLYLEDVQVAPTVTERTPEASGAAPYISDPGNAERIWQISRELLDGARS
jgi:NAD(P)-dependent dehydrogenase (short-subunit alcohol dehydrogenase family)